MKLRHKLRKLRGDRSVAEIARAAKCSGPTIADIEAGRTSDPKFSIVAGVARYFGVPLDWLADDSADWPPPRSDSQQAVELVRAALAKEGLAGELSDVERKTLAMFRSLPTEMQADVWVYLSTLQQRHDVQLLSVAAEGQGTESPDVAAAHRRQEARQVDSVLGADQARREERQAGGKKKSVG